MNQKKTGCPRCGGELKKVRYGYDEEIAGDVYSYGCMCFGDDRDGAYICKSCETMYNDKIQPVELVTCPLEASNSILSYECRQYNLLRTKENYQLLEDAKKICELICPAIGEEALISLASGEKICGKIERTYMRSVTIPENFLSIYQKTDVYHGFYRDVLIDEIVNVEFPAETEES